MKMRPSISNRATPRQAFSLIELLVVMAIIGVMAAIGVPALKGLGGSNDVGAANRQLLDDLSYARFKAISERTTVYMVFVSSEMLRQPWNGSQKEEIAKLANLQFTSYALFAKRSLGDQPGNGKPRYLTEWKSLPDGTFIPTNKMDFASEPTRLADPLAFRTLKHELIPFPNATNTPIPMPVIAFDYQGRLTQMDDAVLTIAQGSIIYPQYSREGLVVTLEPPEVIETPKMGYTNNPAIRIDWLTGRAQSISPDSVTNYARLFEQ